VSAAVESMPVDALTRALARARAEIEDARGSIRDTRVVAVLPHADEAVQVLEALLLEIGAAERAFAWGAGARTT
jgi:hypothetical protein